MMTARMAARFRRATVLTTLTEAARLRAFIDALLTPTQPIVWHDGTPPPSQGAWAPGVTGIVSYVHRYKRTP